MLRRRDSERARDAIANLDDPDLFIAFIGRDHVVVDDVDMRIETA